MFYFTYIYIYIDICIISSFGCKKTCALQATSLNWNVAVLQQNKFFKSKTTLFLGLGFAKNESDLFSANRMGGKDIFNKALLLVGNIYDRVNAQLRRFLKREIQTTTLVLPGFFYGKIWCNMV